MDPNEALKTIREQLHKLTTSYVYDEEALSEAWNALDEWLKKGGFLPSEWERESPMIVVGQSPATELMHTLSHYHKLNGIRKMRVKIEGSKVKFKVNEGIWSPPFGEIQEPY